MRRHRRGRALSKRYGHSTVRLSVRPSTYRSEQGFNVSGRVPWTGWPVRIFSRTRRGADAIVNAYKAHEAGHITLSELQQVVDRNL